MIDNELKSIQFRFEEMERQLNKYREMESLSPLENLSEKVRKERKKQSLTLHQLAELSAVSYSSLVKLESGDDSVNLKTLRKITESLGMKIWIG